MSDRSCQRFSRLSSEAEDRELKPSEQRFLDTHRDECEACLEEAATAFFAMNMLREAAYEEDEIEISPMFDERIIRMVRLNSVRSRISYWSPAALGAGVACIALFAVLHVAATPTQMKEAEVPGGQARNTVRKHYPNLELETDKVPEFLR